MNRTEQSLSQHDWSSIILIVHEWHANTLCAFTSVLEKCEEICTSHSYREADGKICDLFAFYWETDTLKCYGESWTLSKKEAQTKKTDKKRRKPYSCTSTNIILKYFLNYSWSPLL